MKNKVLAILLSVFVAFGLWLYVVTVEHTQIELTFYNIPVNWNGEEGMNDRNLRLVDRNMTVSMKLYGNRGVLNKMKSSDIIVLADLTHITEAGEKKLSYEVSFSGVQTEAIEIVDRPASIEVQVARWMDKTIPVEVETVGNLGQTNIDGIQYVTDEIIWDLPTVDISGPYEVVESITVAKVFADIQGKTATVEERMNLVLCDALGNRLGDVSSVYVSNGGSTIVKVPVVAEKTVTLDIPVDPGEMVLAGVPTPLFSIVKDGKTEKVTAVTIRGSLSAVQSVTTDNLFGDKKITLKKDTKEYTETVAFQLPEGVWCKEGSAVTVNLTVSHILSLPTGQIIPGGEFEKYSVQYITPYVSIAYFGSGDKDKITVSDVKVTLIFSEASVISGKFRYNVEIVKGGEEIPCWTNADMTIEAIASLKPSAVDLSDLIEVGA